MRAVFPALVIAASAASAFVAGCATEPGVPPTVTLGPLPFDQISPGGGVDVWWSATGAIDFSSSWVGLISAEGDPTVYALYDHGAVARGVTQPGPVGFWWHGVDLLERPLPPGYYDVWLDLGEGRVKLAGAQVIVQGLTFTTPAAGTAPQSWTTGQLAMSFATMDDLDVQLEANFVPIAEAHVAAGSATQTLTVPWNGTFADGSAPAPGNYVITARVTDASGGDLFFHGAHTAVSYAVAGGRVVIP